MNMKKFTLIFSFLGLSSLAFAQPAAPALGQPADGSIGVSVFPQFTWDTTGTGVDSFVLFVGNMSDLSDADSSFIGNGVGFYMRSNALDSAANYYWSVASIDSNGLWGQPALPRMFKTVDPPPAPSLTAPESGSIFIAKKPLLEWTAVPTATSYRIHIAAFTNFGDTVYHATSNTNSHTVNQTLAEYTVYYWRVLAENAEGLSAWANYWNFTTVLTGVSSVSKGDFAMSLYPNPTDANTNLNFTLNQGGNAHISVMDLSGKEVMTVHEGQVNAGTQNFRINGSELKSGIYFVQVNVNGVAQMMKLSVR